MKNMFFKMIGSYLFVLFFPLTMTLSVSFSTAMGAVYDDFNGSDIDSTLWDRNDGGAVFTQSGGFLNVDISPSKRVAELWSRNKFRGDVEFVLDFRDFQTTATTFSQGLPNISLSIGWEDGKCLLIYLYYQDSSHFLSSAYCNDPSGGVNMQTSATSGLFKISRNGSTITTSYNLGSGWVSFGTFTGADTGDVQVSIEAQTGDNGTTHFSCDWIKYEGQIVSTNIIPPTGFSASVSGSTVSLGWNPVFDTSGYKLYYGTSSGNYTGSADLGNATSQVFNNVPDGTYLSGPYSIQQLW